MCTPSPSVDTSRRLFSSLNERRLAHLVGTPERVIEPIQGFVDLGVGEVVVEFVDFPETDGAELFADEMIPEFSAGRRVSPVHEVLSHVISKR